MSAILVAMQGDSAPWVARLKELLPAHRVVTPGQEFDADDIAYVVSWKHAPSSLAPLTKLRALFSLGAGVDHVFADPGLPDVPVVRVVDPDLRDRMSEWVLLHVLMHHRRQRMYDYLQHEKLWEDETDQPVARDVRVGVMGLGVLGADAAAKLKMIGFDVAGWSRTAKEIAGIACFCGPEGLDEFLARTDILVCLLPLTPQTQGMIDAPLLRKLARDGRLGGPALINAGRGKLQVEADILECLDEGSLMAATLDVFETEPLPQASPLWSHPRVTVTPHISASSEPLAIARYIAGQITAFEGGAALANVVDKERRY